MNRPSGLFVPQMGDKVPKRVGRGLEEAQWQSPVQVPAGDRVAGTGLRPIPIAENFRVATPGCSLKIEMCDKF